MVLAERPDVGDGVVERRVDRGVTVAACDLVGGDPQLARA